MSRLKLNMVERSGLLAKFCLMASILVVCFVTFGVLTWVWLGEISKSVSYLTDKVELRSEAAYEMEINVIGVNLGIVNYVHNPRPQYIDRFRDDSADFWKFFKLYESLGDPGEESEFAKTIAKQFQAILDLGQRIISDVDALPEVSKNLSARFHEYDAALERLMVSDLKGNSYPVVELHEMLDRYRMVFHADGDGISRESIREEIRGTGADMRAVLSRLESEHPDISSISMRLEQELFDYVGMRQALADRIQTLSALREEIDSTLDEGVQARARDSIIQTGRTISNQLGVAARDVGVMGVIGILGTLLALAFLLVMIIQPIRKLVLMVECVSKGEMESRVDLPHHGEIGVLANAFNNLTRDVEAKQRILQHAKTELEYMVMQRTQQLETVNEQLEQELTNKEIMIRQLWEATKLAQSASRAKSAFLAHMSHELRTPLNGIIGLAEMMKMRIFGPIGDSRYEEYVGDILESGQHLRNQIGNVLEAANVEIQEVALTRDAVNPGEIVEYAMAGAKERAGACGVRLETDIPENLPSVWVDRKCIQKVIGNLVENAVKFSPRNGTVFLKARTYQQGDVVLTISDRGAGMSRQHLEAALVFFGIDDSMIADQSRGLGLGLSVGKRLIELQDGILEIDTELDRGTVVTVSLPREPSPSAGPAAQ